jgi:hypothetical protein
MVGVFKMIDFSEEKLILSLTGILVITGVAFAGIHWSGLTNFYSTFVSGIVSIITIFSAGNLTSKFIDSKYPGQPDPPEPTDPTHPPGP